MHIAIASFEFDDRISNQLARPMICDFAAARDAIDRNFARPLREKESLICAAPECEYMRMLQYQQRVGNCVRLSRRYHRSLERERRLILDRAEIRDAQYAGDLGHLYIDYISMASPSAASAACIIASDIVGCGCTVLRSEEHTSELQS